MEYDTLPAQNDVGSEHSINNVLNIPLPDYINFVGYGDTISNLTIKEVQFGDGVFRVWDTDELDGTFSITANRSNILSMLAVGMSVHQIAKATFRTKNTIDTNISIAKRTLGLGPCRAPYLIDQAFQLGVFTVKKPIENNLSEPIMNICRLTADGFTARAIKDHMGITKYEYALVPHEIKNSHPGLPLTMPAAIATYLHLAGVRFEP